MDGFRVTEVNGIAAMQPRSPLVGNAYFLGGGMAFQTVGQKWS